MANKNTLRNNRLFHDTIVIERKAERRAKRQFRKELQRSKGLR